jgi:hypothetical protein
MPPAKRLRSNAAPAHSGPWPPSEASSRPGEPLVPSSGDTGHVVAQAQMPHTKRDRACKRPANPRKSQQPTAQAPGDLSRRLRDQATKEQAPTRPRAGGRPARNLARPSKQAAPKTSRRPEIPDGANAELARAAVDSEPSTAMRPHRIECAVMEAVGVPGPRARKPNHRLLGEKCASRTQSAALPRPLRRSARIAALKASKRTRRTGADASR